MRQRTKVFLLHLSYTLKFSVTQRCPRLKFRMCACAVRNNGELRAGAIFHAGGDEKLIFNE